MFSHFLAMLWYFGGRDMESVMGILERLSEFAARRKGQAASTSLAGHVALNRAAIEQRIREPSMFSDLTAEHDGGRKELA